MKDICFSISYLTILITLWILRLLSSSNSNFHQEVRTIDRASTTNRHLRPLPPKHRLPRTSSTRPSFSPSRGEGGQGFPQFTHQSSANSVRLAGPPLHLLAGQGGIHPPEGQLMLVVRFLSPCLHPRSPGHFPCGTVLLPSHLEISLSCYRMPRANSLLSHIVSSTP